jgi:hypothetical protein
MEFTIIDASKIESNIEIINCAKQKDCFLVVENNNPYTCGMYDTFELAEIAIQQAMLEFNKNHPIGNSVWVKNGANDRYLRVSSETLKNFPFGRICSDANLYEVKYQIFSRTTNAFISYKFPIKN